MNTAENDLELLHTHFSAISKLDIDGIMATFHPNIIIEAPFTPEIFSDTVPSRIEGKDAVGIFFKSLSDLVEPLKFYDLNIEALQQPGEFVCRFRGNSKFLATQLPYKNRYISRISVRDGLVFRMTEFYNPIVILTSLGGNVTLPSARLDGKH